MRSAAHMVFSEGLGVPESSAGAVRLLGVHGIVPVEVAEPVARAVGCNVLVHEYAEVDDDAVWANVAPLDDLEGFTAALARWVARSD